MSKLLKKTGLYFCFALMTGVVSGLHSPSAEAKLYKWVDEQGNIYYSDRVPPQEVKHKREVINESGVRTLDVDRAKTKEELIEERQRAALLEQEQENRRKVQEYHRNLVANYRDERDLIDTRDRNIESIQVSINFVEANLSGLTSELDSMVKEAASYERSGVKTPKLLKAQIAEIRGKIDEANDFIKEKQGEQRKVRSRYNEELELYRILTGTQRATATANR